jgi:outer membrane protein TolC
MGLENRFYFGSGTAPYWRLTQYDGTVAAYRQTTRTAFRQVEDNLNALHNLEIEAQQQHDAAASAQQSLDLFNTRYEDGIDTYLQVTTWQTALLQNHSNDIQIARRRFEAGVLLVKALGDGWDISQPPQQPGPMGHAISYAPLYSQSYQPREP